MVTIKDLTFSYGEVKTLRGVNMEFQTGKVTCIMGRNGVGKTTLFNNVMGLLKPSGGSITMDVRYLPSISNALVPGSIQKVL